ncbi:hypothetical protein MASR2M79_25150 [Aminivibrio sp.]
MLYDILIIIGIASIAGNDRSNYASASSKNAETNSTANKSNLYAPMSFLEESKRLSAIPDEDKILPIKRKVEQL